jgi:hypothetical protein
MDSYERTSGGAIVKTLVIITLLCMLWLFPSALFAQSPGSLDERLKSLEETLKKQQQTIEQQQKMIEALKSEVRQRPTAAAPQAASSGKAAPADEMREKVRDLNEKVDRVLEAQRKVMPSEFNPAIGIVGETVFSYRSRNNEETGSERPGGWDIFQRSVELNASASVDPFATAYVVINASADAETGEADLGVEEAALETDSLPWNLSLKAGRFFGEFGRLAYIHGHELPFVNRPLALDRYIGGESKTDGLQINWLVPIAHYVSLTLGAGNQFGGDAPPNNVGGFRHGSGLNYWGRLSTYFDLTPDISLEPGVSFLWNPSTIDRGGPLVQPDGNAFTERERRLFGADLVLSYKPLRDNQFKSLVWGTEVLYSDNCYDVSDPSGGALGGRSVGSLGLYSYVTYRFHRQWSTGFLFDYVEDATNHHARTCAYSPYITWALSHWNQLRLQYTYTDPSGAAEAAGLASGNAVYLQWAWIIGSHSHGWQQR